MCLKLDLDRKAQPCEGLPRGWLFAFEEASTNPKFNGLVLLAPCGKRYVSVGYAKRNNAYRAALENVDSLSSAFYDSIGLTADGWSDKHAITTVPMAPGGASQSSTSSSEVAAEDQTAGTKLHARGRPPKLLNDLRQLWEKRCKMCANCTRENCGKCETCIRNPSPKECCLRRVRMFCFHLGYLSKRIL
jgi:hypothetical protein